MSRKVIFKDWECDVKKAQYSNGRIALQLTHPIDGPIATATVNFPDYPLPSDEHTFIKTWSENDGILEALMEAEIVENTGMSFEINDFGSKAVMVKVLI